MSSFNPKIRKYIVLNAKKIRLHSHKSEPRTENSWQKFGMDSEGIRHAQMDMDQI